MMTCLGCQWRLRPSEEVKGDKTVSIERFDRSERLYLSTGDFAALQQMKTVYPVQTRTLIEDVLKLGQVDEPDINARFLMFFQDSTLQTLMSDVDMQFADVDDLNMQLTKAFGRLAKLLPGIRQPLVYTQIGSLDQSIVVGDGQLGISLDKYLGSNYPLYLRFGYTEEQRAMMTRRFIVPDCLGFYLLSLFPSDNGDEHSHIAKIQYVVNQAMDRKIFTRQPVADVERFMRLNPHTSVHELLKGAVTVR
mgnify:CR=1 FL=1